MARQLPLFDFKQQPTPRAKGLRQELHRFFFGDDIFISYSRSDAGRYATALAARLSEAGYLCFLDQLGTDADQSIPGSLRDKVRKSSALVLVGTRGAAASRYVREEVEIFKESRRPILPIDVDGALVGEDWPELAGLSRIPESGKHVAKGEPAPATLTTLRNASRYRRRNQSLRLSLAAGAALLLLVTLAAGLSAYLFFVANEKAAAARESAASAVRQEKGARATLLARVRGREFDALTLAVEAAEPEVGAGRTPSEEIVNGLTAAVMAIDQAVALRDLRGGIKVAQLSPDARRVFVATFERSADERGPGTERWGVWDAQTGARLSALMEGPSPDSGVTTASFSRDGARLFVAVTRGPESTLWLCDLSRTSSCKLSRSPDGNPYPAALDSDGRKLAFVNRHPQQGGPAAMFVTDLDWDAPDPLPARSSWKRLKLSPPASAAQTAFAPDGRLLLFSYDPILDSSHAYDVSRCEQSGDCAPSGAVTPAGLLGITDDGEPIILTHSFTRAGGNREPVIHLADWPGKGGVTIKRTLRGFKGVVRSAAFAGGRAYVATVHGERVYISGAAASDSFAALRAHDHDLHLVRYSPDGRFVVTVGARGEVNLWDARRNVLLYSRQLPGGDKASLWPAASFSADGERVAAMTPSGFGVWKTSDGGEVARPCASLPQLRSGFDLILLDSIHGSGQVITRHRIATEHDANKYIVWDAATCAPVRGLETAEHLDSPKASPQRFKVFLRDGPRVVTVGDDRGVYLWNLSEAGTQAAAGSNSLTPQKIGALPDGPYAPLTAAFEGGVTLLVVNQSDNSFYVWRDGRLRRLSGAIRYWPNSPFHAAISPDGTFAAGANYTGEAIVWDLAGGAKIFGFDCDLSGSWPAAPLAFSPDGRKLAVATRDGVARIYPVTASGFVAAARRMLHNGDR